MLCALLCSLLWLPLLPWYFRMTRLVCWQLEQFSQRYVSEYASWLASIVNTSSVKLIAVICFDKSYPRRRGTTTGWTGRPSPTNSSCPSRPLTSSLRTSGNRTWYFLRMFCDVWKRHLQSVCRELRSKWFKIKVMKRQNQMK